MSSEDDLELAQDGIVIYVGQDRAGHWLVQDGGKSLEGRFVSRSAALSFAQAERETYGARLEITDILLIPIIPFAPVSADERALSQAA